MLPSPWSIPADSYKQFAKLDKRIKETNKLKQNISYSDSVVADRASEDKAMMDAWFASVIELMIVAGLDMEDDNIGALFVDRKRKQIVFIDEYDAFMDTISDKPKDVQEIAKATLAINLKHVEPSDMVKDQMIEDIFKGRVKVI